MSLYFVRRKLGLKQENNESVRKTRRAQHDAPDMTVARRERRPVVTPFAWADAVPTVVKVATSVAPNQREHQWYRPRRLYAVAVDEVCDNNIICCP